MLDPRPVAYVIGLLVTALGAVMFVPMGADLIHGNGHWDAFFECAVITMLAGGTISISCSNSVPDRLSLQQIFMLTTGVWIFLPVFGALPLMIGDTELGFTDAFFEAMSGLTTTGSTVITGLDDLPEGILMWRGLLQWLGGIGVIVVAMVFLPELRVGGMQIFRSEGFETMGKILPRATQISGQISLIYIAISLACIITYVALGMDVFDAIVHAMTTVSTGGFANYDASFSTFSGAPEYAASFFMILSALPFVRYVQMVNGDAWSLWRDSQVRTFFAILAVLVVVTSVVLLSIFPHHWEQALREALFNIVSIISGTGYASVDYMTWGPFLIGLFFFIGLIGGCAGSTACSIKVFRYQLLFASIRSQLMKIRSPHGVFITRYEGRRVSEEVLSSVISFFVFFVVSLGVLAVGLSLTGLDNVTAISGAATALANIGPGLGDIIGPAGNFSSLNDPAKWMLSAAMLVGRLEIMAVYVMLTVKFWRA